MMASDGFFDNVDIREANKFKKLFSHFVSCLFVCCVIRLVNSYLSPHLSELNYKDPMIDIIHQPTTTIPSSSHENNNNNKGEEEEEEMVTNERELMVDLGG